MDDLNLHNRKAWDALVARGSGFASTVDARALEQPERHINIYNWLPDGVRGRRVLCLAAGGGKHGPLYAAAGAEVTVVDLSEAMLAKDRRVASEYGLKLRCIAGCMTRMPDLLEAEFDLIIQPVSSCYITDPEALHAEAARVLKPGGVYIVQHKQPVSLQADAAPTSGGYRMGVSAFHQGPLPSVEGYEHREEGTVEFLHSLESLVGGLCRAGFVIEDLREPRHGDPSASMGTFRHRAWFVPPYVTLKARRRLGTPRPNGSVLQVGAR